VVGMFLNNELIDAIELKIVEVELRDWSVFSWSENGDYADKMCDFLNEVINVGLDMYTEAINYRLKELYK
jgi:hypothetical protein